jgi:hypothetical protein
MVSRPRLREPSERQKRQGRDCGSQKEMDGMNDMRDNKLMYEREVG